MNLKPILCALIVLSIAASAPPSRAQNKIHNDQISSREAEVRIAVANQHFKRVVVKLNNGSTVSGLIDSVSENSFSVTHIRELVGPRKTETISYSDVATIQGRNPMLKALKRIAIVPVAMAFVAITTPVCQVSILLRHPVLCPCYSGLP